VLIDQTKALEEPMLDIDRVLNAIRKIDGATIVESIGSTRNGPVKKYTVRRKDRAAVLIQSTLSVDHCDAFSLVTPKNWEESSSGEWFKTIKALKTYLGGGN
jgi:hypothetical protein